MRAALEGGSIEIKGRMPWSSNGTFLVEVCHEFGLSRAVYKPQRGERPLWDFPDGLYRREVAAYELARALDWDMVPITVLREDAPYGIGSLQHFVDADFEQHYFTLYEDEEHDWHDQLQRMCVFDLLANNTDRKSGHCLLGPPLHDGEDGHVWGIDNGLSFHAEFKLRTVIWEYATQLIPSALLESVGGLLERGLPDDLARLLAPLERDALLTRARAVVTEGRFPVDPTGRRYPWPLV